MDTRKSTARLPLRTIIGLCLERDTITHAVKTALVVGTILALINHGADILSGHFAWRWVAPLLITYLVPFSVTTSGVVHGKAQRRKQMALA
jgi:hypothetical protein